MKYFISLLILLCLIFGSDIQRHISMSIVFSKGFNVLANWAFQGFGCASNDLQIQTLQPSSLLWDRNRFSLNLDQCNFGKIDCQQELRSVRKQKIHFNEMQMNCTVSCGTGAADDFVSKKQNRQTLNFARQSPCPPTLCCILLHIDCIFVAIFCFVLFVREVHRFVEKPRSETDSTESIDSV